MKKDELVNVDVFFSNCIDLLCLFNRKWFIEKVNVNWEKDFNYPFTSLKRKRITDLIHPDDYTSFVHSIEEVCTSRNPCSGKCRFQNQGGNYLWVEWNLFLLNSKLCLSSRIIHFQRESHADIKYKLLFENMTSGFALHEMIYDSLGKPYDYRYIEANPAFERLTDISAKTVIGKTIREVVPDIEEQWIENFGQVAITGLPISYVGYSPVLGRYYETYVFSPEKDKFAVVFNDISEKVNAEKELRSTLKALTESELKYKLLNNDLELRVFERTKQLEQAIQELEAFSYSVSHDLRAPVRHISGFIQLLYNNIQNKTESINDYYSKIQLATGRMSVMIDSLLAFSRLGRKELNIRENDPNNMIREIIEDFIPDLDKRQITWNISELPGLKCDYNLVKMALSNLISNAIKYTSQNKSATITISSRIIENNILEILITDDGIGFDMSCADRLFGVFQRLHSAELFEGLGIGLANVKRITDKHKWKIRAESEPGLGATFIVSIDENSWNFSA